MLGSVRGSVHLVGWTETRYLYSPSCFVLQPDWTSWFTNSLDHLPPIWKTGIRSYRKGRNREFWQLNADIFGEESLRADIEALTLSLELLRAFNPPV